MRRLAIAAGLSVRLLAQPAPAQDVGDAVRMIQQQLPYGQGPLDGMPGMAPASQLIPQSAAVAAALQIFPGGKPIGVRLLSGPRPVYAVKIRTQGQVARVLVDAQTAQVIGQ